MCDLGLKFSRSLKMKNALNGQKKPTELLAMQATSRPTFKFQFNLETGVDKGLGAVDMFYPAQKKLCHIVYSDQSSGVCLVSFTL